MRKFIVILYLPLFFIANTASAEELYRLIIYKTPRAIPAEDVATIQNESGEKFLLEDPESALRLVNFWAMWCAQCRNEMPSLGALNAEIPHDKLKVITVNVERKETPEEVKAYFDEIGVKDLPVYYDGRNFAKKLGVMALPTTYFINRKGEEVARIIGEMDYRDETLREQILALAARMD